MDRALKKLLRLYPIERKWTVLSNYKTPLQSVSFNSNSTDHTRLQDVILSMEKNVPKFKISYEILKILERTANSTFINLDDSINTLSMLFKSTKHVKDVENIRKHKGFIYLCEMLNSHIRIMKTYDIIECLKVFIYFKVPTDSLLVQSLLQMIRTTVNDLSLQDIIFIIFLLKKMDSTPLRDALLIALPLVFETQLPTKLDSDNTSILTSSLRFIIESNINNSKIQSIILESLWKHRNNLDTKLASSVFNSLCYVSNLSPIAFEILHSTQKILTINAKELHIQQIIQILNKLEFVIANNKDHGDKFYDEALVDAFINSVLSSNINFASGINLLKVLNNLNYVHIPLLEYLAARCFEQPYLLKNASYVDISIFIKGFINADYKPVFWDTIRDAILANNMKNKSFSISIIRFTLHMIALDCYNPNLLNKVFCYDINNAPMKNIVARELLLLYQSVKTLYPAYNGSWPSQNTIQYAINLDPILSTFSLKAALELALGGSQYIYNNLKTKLGHHIDHVIVMRKGGYPVAINTINNIIYVEDIPNPSMSQIILIFNLPDTAYAINSQRLKSTWSLKIKSAETLTNSNAIAINSTSWLKLPEYERIPYLMQAIKLKSEHLLESAN